MSDKDLCINNIEKMLKRSQTKIIFPLITLGVIKEYHDKKKSSFSDTDIRKCYEETIKYMVGYLNHDLHIGGKYYDAYPSRNLPKYGVLRVSGNKQYELLSPYKTSAEMLITWIPERIRRHINERLGLIPNLGDQGYRAKLSANNLEFISTIREYTNTNPTNFEIFSFAIIKVHLEKFACKVYRDT
ncbi:unnamed protein product, partial [marine sediment metagenome]